MFFPVHANTTKKKGEKKEKERMSRSEKKRGRDRKA